MAVTIEQVFDCCQVFERAGYHLYHAIRAGLLRRLGRSQQSRAAYGKAIELAGNTAETAYLTRRRDQLG
jgi:RNA polymerase sigma-70 factor (ECF subfamily)